MDFGFLNPIKELLLKADMTCQEAIHYETGKTASARTGNSKEFNAR